MKSVFKKRQANFQKRQQGYLRYVFNDHFVIVIMFVLGYLLFQYSQLLKHFPSNHLPIIVGLTFISGLVLMTGNMATYLEKPDNHFLLSKEEEVISHIRASQKKATIIGILIQTFVLIMLFPLFKGIGISLPFFIIILILLAIIKRFIIKGRTQRLFNNGNLEWGKAIDQETHRKQKILSFYSLFTNVKGISTSFKERKYLNGFLNFLKKDHPNLWKNLYLRAFLRSSDYLGLTIRLSLLSCLALFFISNQLLALLLASVFNYVLLFQLLALYHHYDYHYLSLLLPVDEELKAKNLLSFLAALSTIIVIVEVLVGHRIFLALGLLSVMLIINLFILPYKLKNIID